MILHGKWFQKTNYAKKEAEVHVFVLRLISLFLRGVAGNKRLRETMSRGVQNHLLTTIQRKLVVLT